MKHLRIIIVVAVLANVLVLGWLLLRPPPEQAPERLADVLEPLVEDDTMSAARFDLSDQQKAQLNVIVISMDALRYDATGLSGKGPSNTPNLDQFAQEAVVFHSVWSAASWTLPSHMSMWTARWPSIHRVTNKLSLLGAEKMAETTLSAGIETYPNLLVQQGFTAAGFTGGAGVQGRYGFARGFSTYLDDRRFAGLDYSAPAAVQWLDQHRDDGRFFLFVHGYDSHGQHPLPASVIQSIPYEGALDGSTEEQARLREQGLAAIQKPGDDPSLVGELGEADAAFLRDVYDRKVRQADERLGTLLGSLRQKGLLDTSIVVILSDHGDEFMEHGHVDHGHSLYEEQLHTVLLMRIPGYARRQDVQAQVRSLDLFPTIFELLGIPGPPGVDGRSLLPLMRGQPDPHARPSFAETDYRLYVHQRALRDGQYKLVLDLQDGERELYDLAADPDERKDISSAEPRRTYELEQSLRTWMGQSGTNPQDYLGMRQKPIEIF
jgi:arylsulfatase A-like enzyme